MNTEYWCPELVFPQPARAVNNVLKQTVSNALPLAENLPAKLASVTPPSSWAWLTLTGPPIMVAIKSTNPSPVAMRSFTMVLAPLRLVLERFQKVESGEKDEL
jgi:hypothetical protein